MNTETDDTAACAEPDWDLTPYFSAVSGDDFTAFRNTLAADVEAMAIRAAGLSAPDAASARSWQALLRDLEGVSARFSHLSSYLSCVGAADARNDDAKREASALSALGAVLTRAFVSVRAAFKLASADVFDAVVDDDSIRHARFYLSRIRDQSTHTMEADLEALAADLSVDGIDAWGRLYDQVSGNLEFTLAVPGEPEQTLPVAMTRTLLEDADPAVRRAALAGGNAAWEGVADTLAACLNAIAGTRLTLYKRRGIDHFLTPALFDAAIERKTLDAMFDAVRGRQELPRRFLRRKARLLGMPALGFEDLMAAPPAKDGTDERIAWERGSEQVLSAFGRSYPALQEFAEHALANRWVNYTPRPGKRPGGFCTSSPVIGESRVFMTYNGATGDVQTLAHELGHAFHNWLMKSMPHWSRRYPMTLAETASTFAETVVTDAFLSNPDTDDGKRLTLLDTRLQDATAFMLNIPMRFDFEADFYTERQAGELSVSRFKELMVDAQRKNYGDAVDPERLDPWFWASKLHFYISDVSFYNFPYTFGYLFSLGIFARAKAEGATFLPTYEALLRATGSGTAEQVARDSLGVDLGSPEFWNASIDLVEEDLSQYEALTES